MWGAVAIGMVVATAAEDEVCMCWWPVVAAVLDLMSVTVGVVGMSVEVIVSSDAVPLESASSDSGSFDGNGASSTYCSVCVGVMIEASATLATGDELSASVVTEVGVVGHSSKDVLDAEASVVTY